MGKLNIAHHKSYHPYRLDNIERVRRDEEEARLKEAKEEGRMALADAEARIDLLRERAGAESKKKKSRRVQEKEEEQLIAAGNLAIAPTPSEPTTSSLSFSGGKHINLFEDLEQKSMADTLQAQSATLQKAKATNDEKGVALAPSEKDRNPWYSSAPKFLHDADTDPLRLNQEDNGPLEESNRDRDRRLRGSENGKGKGRRFDDTEFMKESERRARDMNLKCFNDPMKEVDNYLKKKEERRKEEERRNRYRRPLPPPPSKPSLGSTSTPDSSSTVTVTSANEPPDARSSRLNRESSERQRALDLIARKKREAAGSVMSTPTSVSGGGYGDVFNKRETDDAFNRRRGRVSGGGGGWYARDERRVRW